MKPYWDREGTFILPGRIQEMMDSNCNCCINCTYFKLLKSTKSYNYEDYKNLKAHCTNSEAIEEKKTRGRTIILRAFLVVDSRQPKVRTNCKYFELG